MANPYVCQQLDETGQCLQWVELTDGIMSSVPHEIINSMFMMGISEVLIFWFLGLTVGIGVKLVRMS